MKLTRDIQSLSVFKRDSAKFVRQLKRTKEPIVLTINGKAAVVVQDSGSYQELLDAKDRIETIKGIKRGLEDISAGRRKPADKFFAEFFSSYDIPEED